MDIEKINRIKEDYLRNYKAKQIPIIKESIEDYLMYQRETLENLSVPEAKHFLISAENEKIRRKMRSCRELGFWIKPGDIVYADFGAAYLSEIGYQHPALVINVFSGKALVIPMTSNRVNIIKAYDDRFNPEGSRHLMNIGIVPGLNRESVLFLNDVKFINTARVIDIKGHMDTGSELFESICERIWDCMKSRQ
ncbi:MAG: type II toxin-antitoxin system PemK/MazF family toxin [Erysipelotrichaceae bacterium]|nr:type II toxin-antitoxin system PemK/MazF family toxin [Erysipelotrichaceae bacterium]